MSEVQQVDGQAETKQVTTAPAPQSPVLDANSTQAASQSASQPASPVAAQAVRQTAAGGVRQQTLPAAASKPREDGVTLLAMYHFLLAGLTLLGTVGLSIPTVITGIVGVVEDSDALIATFILGSLAVVTMVLSLFLLIVGYGLWSQRQWGRVAAIAIGMLSLFAIPIGTLIGGVSIWYLAKPEVAAEFR